MTVDAQHQIAAAARAALRGELVVLPTDTVYGIGTRPDEPTATARLFEAKERPRHLDLPVLVPSVEAAREIAEFDDDGLLLARALWPGPVTLVTPRTTRSRSWQLGAAGETVGVRVPADPIALAVLGLTGPLAVTSANRSGEPPPEHCSDVERAFGSAVAIYLCADRPLGGRPSTVVEVASGDVRILRDGAVSEDQILRILSTQTSTAGRTDPPGAVS